MAVVASATAVEGTALEATGRAGGAEGWMVQVHVEEGWAMWMVGGVATVALVTAVATVQEGMAREAAVEAGAARVGRM
jgi:hypothetical protein